MPTTTARTEFLAGVRAELPILLGVAPFGMIYGVRRSAPACRGRRTGDVVDRLRRLPAIRRDAVFATGAPGLVLLLTTLIVNLRHMLYSVSLAPYLHKLPARWKWLLAYLLTDEAYAPTILHYRQGEQNHGDSAPEGPCGTEGTETPDKRHWFLLGAGLALWSVWQVSTAVGIFLGAEVPPSWALDFTLALTFIVLLVPVLTDRPSVAAALLPGSSRWPARAGRTSWDWSPRRSWGLRSAPGSTAVVHKAPNRNRFRYRPRRSEMTGTTLWLTMLGMGAITYGIRLSFILLWGKFTLPPTLQRSLRFVPPAVLSAIIFPEILRHGGVWNVSPLNPRLLAGIIAALVAWRTRNTMLTILVGMAALWGLQVVLSR